MKNWKVKIECKNKNVVLKVEAKNYSDAYVNAGLIYPGCVIKSISEIRKK